MRRGSSAACGPVKFVYLGVTILPSWNLYFGETHLKHLSALDMSLEGSIPSSDYIERFLCDRCRLNRFTTLKTSQKAQ